MHPARLAFLAGKHAQPRKVISKLSSASGTLLKLECGHTQDIAPHFDCSAVESRNCRICGEEYVKSAPQYQKEFE